MKLETTCVVFLTILQQCWGVGISPDYEGYVQPLLLRNSSWMDDTNRSQQCREMLESVNKNLDKINPAQVALQDCCDAFLLRNGTGVYWFREVGTDRILCDMDAAGGGWLVFGRRFKNSHKFEKPWIKYVKGFGILTREFWFGLENLHNLTSQPGGAELRIEFDKGKYWVQYEHFSVGNESTDYALQVSGNKSSDNLLFYQHFTLHNGSRFVTMDRPVPCRPVTFDGVVYHDYCCDRKWVKSGWWYANSPWFPWPYYYGRCSYFNPFYSGNIIWAHLVHSTDFGDYPDVRTPYFTSVELKLRVKRQPCPV